MKKYLLLILLNPLFARAQENLTGIWRIEDVKNFKGPRYSNGVPIMFKIQQAGNIISFEVTNSVINHDTTFTQELQVGPDQTNESITPQGNRKTMTLYFDKNKEAWVKKTIVFEKLNPDKQERNILEEFKVIGALLVLTKNSERLDGKDSDEDFIMEGHYEKLTTEQLAQESEKGKGIEFVSGLTWKQIVSKAKRENKYIFVDCYATWCGPCRVMDRDVFSLNMIGDLMSIDFISVKLQLDSTKSDPASIKLLYPIASKFEKEYAITALPTYLVFSPDGKPLHKFIGQQKPKEFIEKINSINVPQKQLLTLFEKVKNKKVPYNEYPLIAQRLRTEFNENALADQVVRFYMDDYLNTLSKDKLLTKKHLDFASRYARVIKPKDELFKIILYNEQLADSIKGNYPIGSWKNSWAYPFVNSVLRTQIVAPLTERAQKNNIEPIWNHVESELLKFVDKDRAAAIRMDVQLNRLFWKAKQRGGKEYVDIVIQRFAQKDSLYIDPNDIDTYCGRICLFSEDTVLLHQALKHMERVTAIGEKMPKNYITLSWIKNKANLLYRLGRKAEAVDLYKKVIADWDTKDLDGIRYSTEEFLRILDDEKFWEGARKLKQN